MRKDQVKNWFQWPFIIWAGITLSQLIAQIFIRTQYPGSLKILLVRELGFFLLATLPSLLLIALLNAAVQLTPVYWLRRLIGLIIMAVLTFYYFANYVVFNLTQYFIAIDTLRFSWLNPYLQLKFFLHAQPYGTLRFFGLWILCLVVAAMAFKALYKFNSKYKFSNRLLVAVYSLAAIFAVLLATRSVPKYLINLEPLSAQLQGYFRKGIVLPEAPARKKWAVLRRPIISVEEYLKKIPGTLKRKNVIVILVESLRPDQLKSFSGRDSVMENVDKLAAKSVLFTQTYSQSAHSTYANPAVFSSQYPLRSANIHLYPNDHRYPRLFIYDLLKAWGYKTAVFSSQDETWGNMSGYMKTDSIDKYFHAGNFSGNAYIPTEETGFTRWLQGDKLSGNLDDSITAGAALKWIDSIGETPFFIYMNFQNSHVPYVIPRDFPRRRNSGSYNYNQGLLHPEAQYVEQDRARYSDSLSYIDAQIGRVIRHLESRKLLQNTILVVAGDNGESFFEHQLVGHAGQLYEEAVRVPLILYSQEMKYKEDKRPAMHIDIVPTLLGMLGLPEHPGFQGLNLLSSNRHENRTRFLVSQSPFIHQFAVVQGSYKLIWTRLPELLELYNLKQDPGEKINLAVQEEKKAEELMGYLKEWIQTQLLYYENPHKYLQEYPPYYSEN